MTTRALNLRRLAALEALRDAVLEAREWRHSRRQDFPALGDWRVMKRLAMAARGPVVEDVDASQVEGVDYLCGRRSTRRSADCSFQLHHHGVHSWAMQVEPLHHATGKRRRATGRSARGK